MAYLSSKPPDVQELQMAILTNMVATGLGAKDSKAENYIISKTSTTSKTKTTVPRTAYDSFAAISTPYKGPNEK